VDLQKTLTIRGFAQHLIDHGSKYSRGDIENILSMVTECLPELVAQGIPVQLGDLGIFRPTCEVKDSVPDIASMEGLNPNEVVKAIHIRFIPNQSKLDNLAGPAFKDQCSLELRNIIDTEKVTVGGKEKTVTTLTPISTAVARLKSGGSGNGGTTGGGTNTGGGGDDGDDTGEND
jgi:predicted histone-like DNA-binding protein